MKKIINIVLMMLLFASPVIADEYLGLKTGDKAPHFKAITYEGNTADLTEINKRGPVVLVFYRGGWCPYCIRQLQELQSFLGDFENLGASVIAISVDLQVNASKTVEEKQLGFTVISDPGAELLELYNLMYKVPDDIVMKYVEYNIDLKAASGRDDHVIAAPATFVIDQNGQIIYAHVNPDYKIRPKTEDILNILKSLSYPE